MARRPATQRRWDDDRRRRRRRRRRRLVVVVVVGRRSLLPLLNIEQQPKRHETQHNRSLAARRHRHRRVGNQLPPL